MLFRSADRELASECPVWSKPVHMKRALVTALVLLATATLGLSQAVPAATPAPATPAPGKPKPLSSTDKTFVKNVAESLYFLTNIAERTRLNAGSESVKDIGAKLLGDLNKVWGEIGTVASANGEMMPTEIKGSDKTHAARLGKVTVEKFDKEYIEMTAKELKRLGRDLESGAKQCQNAELKAVAAKCAPTIKEYQDKAEATLKGLTGKK